MASRTRRPVPPVTPPRNTLRTVLLVLGGLVLTCGGCGLGGFVYVRGEVGYDAAVERATTNARVQKLLGAPVTADFFFSGAARGREDDGRSQLVIPLRGSTQGGKLLAVGVKTSGLWGFSRLEVVGDDGRRVALVGE